MPEGDTVHAAAARVRQALQAGPIREVSGSRLVPHRGRLVGSPVTGIWSRGKQLVIEAGDWSLRVHLGMHGRWTVHGPDRLPGPGGRLRVLVSTDSGAAAAWSAPDVVVDRSPAIVAWLETNLGPDLIRDAIDSRVTAAALEQPHRPIGTVLLDQRVAAGIGNVYKSEVCFRAGVDPFTPVGRLTPGVVEAMYRDAAELLRTNSHRTERMTTGVDRPGQRHFVYGRPGRGCRRCNTPIRRDASGERVTFWCPTCQPPWI